MRDAPSSLANSLFLRTARSAASKTLPPFVALVVFLLTWEIGVRWLGVAAYLLPPPSAILSAAKRDAINLLMGAWTTAKTALFGFALSGVLGVLAAVILSSARVIERAFYPYTVFLQTVPIVAIAPILAVWFGPGFLAVSVCAFIVSVFPVIANTVTGLRSVDPALKDLFRLYGASRWASLVKLTLPSALPNIVTGLRIAGGLSVIGTLVGELFAGFSEGAPGLGIVVQTAAKQLKTDLLFAAVFSATFLGLLLFGVVNAVGSRVLGRWHPSEKLDQSEIES
ncbi:MAG: ABC transporter permease [Polyangiaceae bacterium]|nr:ABC transporter permease [Polyangiaceae bacterium]